MHHPNQRHEQTLCFEKSSNISKSFQAVELSKAFSLMLLVVFKYFFFFWPGPYEETLVPLTWAPVIFSVHASGLGTLFHLNYIYKATEKIILCSCFNLFQD